MSSPRQIVETVLSRAGVAIGGQNPWDITVNDERFFLRVLREKNLGLGEAYMDGWWDCRQLDEFICRVLNIRLDVSVKGGLKYLSLLLPGILFNLQSKARAHIVAERHYNLDSDLFLSFLDPYNQYSCAYFSDTDDLGRAQQNKLDLICRKTALCRTDHVLDIGCGWGGFARYAAETYGCTVTAVNVSREQARYAADFCKHRRSASWNVITDTGRV
jgi:cyclopropane-fatty-acyl-phospholipid synthase